MAVTVPFIRTEVCVYICLLYFPHSSWVLHQLKGVLGCGRASGPVCVQRALPAHPDLCRLPHFTDALPELWWSPQAAAQPEAQHITNDTPYCRAVQKQASCSGSRTLCAAGAVSVLGCGEVPVWWRWQVDLQQAENNHT